MKKNNFLFIIVILVALSINAKSQTDFRPGYVITNQMDTLKGFVDYRGEIRNSKICVYKPSENAEPFTYLPGQIHSYRFVDSKYYISKVVNNDTVFLEYLVDGIVDLYFMCYVGGSSYYLEKDGKLLALINDKRNVNIDGKMYVKNSNQYIGYLKATMSDCMEIQPKLDNASLDHSR